MVPGTPERSTGSCSGFKASQKMGQQLKVSSDRLEEARNRTCDFYIGQYLHSLFANSFKTAYYLFQKLIFVRKTSGFTDCRTNRPLVNITYSWHIFCS